MERFSIALPTSLSYSFVNSRPITSVVQELPRGVDVNFVTLDGSRSAGLFLGCPTSGVES